MKKDKNLIHKFDPIHEKELIEDIFEDFFPTSLYRNFVKNFFDIHKTDMTFSPSTDIIEQDDKFIIKIDLPGIHKDDIKISLDNNILTITATRKKEDIYEKGQIYKREIYYGKFSKSIQLPDDIKEEDIKATFKNGCLNIIINKTKPKEIKVIKVEEEK